jgi:hypothetical protein
MGHPAMWVLELRLALARVAKQAFNIGWRVLRFIIIQYPLQKIYV